mmetsp:Transcript_23995/g.32799  ORF Transcript_23995/g.32799 Transcript_23995/m.32799 type:complete len:148 (-) Transcript_23995:58-501(-)
MMFILGGTEGTSSLLVLAPWEDTCLLISTPIQELLESRKQEKKNMYVLLCERNQVNFMPFVMNVLGPSAIEFIRLVASSVDGTSEDHVAFRRYWIRRLVVTTHKAYLKLLIARQQDRSLRYLKIFELASKTAWSKSVILGCLLWFAS